METRNLLEKGRVVEFKCKTMVTKIGVVVEFITLDSVVVQIVCVRTGKTMQRKVMTLKNLILTDKVIEFDDSEEERGEKFIASVENAIKGAVEARKNKKAYQDYLYTEQKKEMNDFERFLAEQKEIAEENLLKSKGF